jgi:VanZ family protein
LSSPAVHSPVPAAFPRKVWAWLPTLIWLSVLALFSTDTFSAEHTGSVLMKVLHALFGRIPAHRFQQIHFFIRKAAHFGSYGLLGALAFFSWRATWPAAPRWMFRWSALALLLVAAAAALDEFHQTFVSSRTGTVRDVVLDLAGAIFFQAAIAICLGWRQFRLRSATRF